MDERRRAAEIELQQRRDELKSRRENAERRKTEAERTEEYHGRQADQIDQRLVRRAVEGRSKKREQLQDMWRLRSENKKAKAAKEEKRTAEQELTHIWHSEIDLQRDAKQHARRNFTAERRDEAGRIHKRIAEQHPDYAAGSSIGHLVSDPDEMHKVEAYARDYEQIRQRENESVREQMQRGVKPDEASQAASDETLRDYGLYNHSHPTREEEQDDDDRDEGQDDGDREEHDYEEARRQDIARRTGVEIEDEDDDQDEDKGDGHDKGMGY